MMRVAIILAIVFAAPTWAQRRQRAPQCGAATTTSARIAAPCIRDVSSNDMRAAANTNDMRVGGIR